MQSLNLIVLAILVMAGLNVLLVIGTIAVKALRKLARRQRQLAREKLEPALYEYLATGEIQPVLRECSQRELDVLETLMVELLTHLQGGENERVVGLAGELGLVERNLSRLRSRRRWRRARAAQNLGYFGGPGAVEPLSELLSEEDETMRAVAARALSRFGTPEAAQVLATNLNSSSELTGLRMAENLERIGPLAVEPLVELLDTEKRRAQVLAARVLGNLRVYEARPALCRAVLRHWNTDLRAQATLALGKIGNPEDLPTILEAAEDERWPVRVQAANAMGMIGETSAIPTLEKLAVDGEWWVRLNASKSLVNMGPKGEEALLRILEGEDRFARDRAAATLEGRGVTRRLVEELAESNGQGQRARRVIKAMVRAGATTYLGHLAQTLPDKKQRRALQRTMSEAEAEAQ